MLGLLRSRGPKIHVLVVIRHVHGSSSPPPTVALHRSVQALCLAVNRSERKQSLISTVHHQIDAHQARLREYLQIPENEDAQDAVWNTLSRGSLGLVLHDKNIIETRKRLLPHDNRQISASYNRFLQQLYSLRKSSALELNVDPARKIIDYPHSLKKYASVNHTLLYKAYLELPSNPFALMAPRHFEDFLEKFLHHKSDFVRPNAISESSIAGRPPRTVLHSFNHMISKRAEYVKMVSRVLNDMRKNGIPLTLREQNQLIFLSFYKDKPEILSALENSVSTMDMNSGSSFQSLATESYTPFDWNAYMSVKKSLKFLPIDTYNTLLFHAIRHENPQIITDILKDLGLSHLTDVGVKRSTPVFNSKTLQHLMTYFSLKKNVGSLSRTIEEVVNCNMPMDIKLVNRIIKSLCDCGELELAEILSIRVLKGSLDSCEPEDAEKSLYKLLTPEDKYVYKALNNVLVNIAPIVGEPAPTFLLKPTEGTFRPIIKSICESESGQTYAKFINVIEHMEQVHKLPLTTRTVKMVMQKFIDDSSNQWTLAHLTEITSKIISVHDYTYNLTRDSLIFARESQPSMFETELSPKLKDFVKTHWKQPGPFTVPIDRGTFLKLSDDVMEKIYSAFFATINRQERFESRVQEINRLKKLTQKLQIQKAGLEQELEKAKDGDLPVYYQGSNKKDIYRNDELNYIKKGYLIDLIDIVSHD